MTFYVYIMTNKPKGVLYVGMTNNLIRRVYISACIYEHRNNIWEGFTYKYRLKKLVHFEIFEDPLTAIQREKNIKHWVRGWKIKLIEENNPTWKDLWEKLTAS